MQYCLAGKSQIFVICTALKHIYVLLRKNFLLPKKCNNWNFTMKQLDKNTEDMLSTVTDNLSI